MVCKLDKETSSHSIEIKRRFDFWSYSNWCLQCNSIWEAIKRAQVYKAVEKSHWNDHNKQSVWCI